MIMIWSSCTPSSNKCLRKSVFKRKDLPERRNPVMILISPLPLERISPSRCIICPHWLLAEMPHVMMAQDTSAWGFQRCSFRQAGQCESPDTWNEWQDWLHAWTRTTIVILWLSTLIFYRFNILIPQCSQLKTSGIILSKMLNWGQNTTKRQFTDFNTVNCRFVRITQVGVHENRYCQIGSISQPLGNPIAARSISGKSTNSQRSFASISLFGDMMSRKYLMTHIVK